MSGNESSPLISVMGTKVPRNESSSYLLCHCYHNFPIRILALSLTLFQYLTIAGQCLIAIRTMLDMHSQRDSLRVSIKGYS